MEFKLGRVRFDDSKERYFAMRAASLSADYIAYVTEKLGTKEETVLGASRNLYIIGRTLAAIEFRRIFGSDTRPEILSPRPAGEPSGVPELVERYHMFPHVMSHMGWGQPEITQSSFEWDRKKKTTRIGSDITVLQSVEAASWAGSTIEGAGQSTRCVMAAGFITQWAKSCFNTPLVAIELSCKSGGDEGCRFVLCEERRVDRAVHKALHSIGSTVDPHTLTGMKLLKIS